mmetsp:Transcript_4127/g.4680  ORF Transcript_4127/g.4680 Transcript_4127/m.4680 type:complete len:875 (-) Transcript_4127:7-2631(-)
MNSNTEDNDSTNDNSYHNNSFESNMGSLGGGSNNGGEYYDNGGGGIRVGGGSNNTTPFFADITLDISVAHDIAETPEAVNRKIFDANHPVTSSLPDFPTIPEFQQSSNNNYQQKQKQQDYSPLRELSLSLSQRTQEPYTQQLYDKNYSNTLIQTQQLTHQQQQHVSSSNNNINKYNNIDNINDNNNNADDDDNNNIDEGVGLYDDFDDENHVMACVTSNNTLGGRFRPFGNSTSNSRSRLRRRQWPKDSKWAIAFWIVVPLGLFVPLVRYGSNSDSVTSSSSSWLAASASPRSATLHTLIWGLIVAVIFLPRLLYRTSGGVGVGDDARHFASQLLLASAPISACVYLALLGATYFLLPSATWPYGLIPLWFLARDLYLFRRWKMTSTTPGGRQAFFQALACAALDILSRSLRRKPLYRTVIMVIIGQFVVIAIWRLSLLAALRSGSFFWTVMAFVGGKWATGTVARLLTLTACGGVSNWFAEQSALLEGMQKAEERQEQNHQQQHGNNSSDENYIGIGNDNDEEMIEFSVPPSKDQRQSETHNNSNGNRSSNSNSQGLHSNGSNHRPLQMEDTMPEAYRIADASQYKSTVGPGMDGDYESDDNESCRDEDSDDEENYIVFLKDSERRTSELSSQRRRWRRERQRHEHKEQRDNSRCTIRQFFVLGLTVSFGSVAKCGLLGGLAQFVYDHARATVGGTRGIDERSSSNRNGAEGESLFRRLMYQVNAIARNFVRTHSDMAMSYVADYQMSYTRAAQEVAILVDEAGVEPIIHDDISAHMSACVGGSVSGIIILFTGAILVHKRNENDQSIPDSSVAFDMVLAFFFCYTLIFTVMEPLRASIKAVYVCFAQYPAALSQAFPLIFHRLSRMSQSNLQ